MQAIISLLYQFIHEVQKERGLSVLFVKSVATDHSELLEQQFTQVDRSIAELTNLNPNFSHRFEPFLNALRYIQAKRKYTMTRMTHLSDLIAFYSKDIIAPALELIEELCVLNFDNQPTKVVAFINFLQWKERVGLERAYGTHIVGVNIDDHSDMQKRLSYLISEQRGYERMFVLLTKEGQKIVEKLNRENEVFQRIENIHNALAQGAFSFSKDMTAIEWFNLFSSKMEVLYELGMMMLHNLQQPEQSIPVNTPTQYANQNLTHKNIETHVHLHKDEIKKLPVFSGLEAGVLDELLRHARVIEHAKGSHVFMQGEQPTRIYFILKGWVKLYKGNMDGQESVLQILSAGNSLSDAAMLDPSPLAVSAQAVDHVTLLSIPATIMREKLKVNHALAVNVLATISHRSQALITQFEQLTLKTVVQRVGWFILNLYLDSHEKTLNLKLPYEKSLVASYLGMKPETFSRTLQMLKEQGIDIERQSICIENIGALCNFCDAHIAVKCGRRGTQNCPHSDCAEKKCALSA